MANNNEQDRFNRELIEEIRRTNSLLSGQVDGGRRNEAYYRQIMDADPDDENRASATSFYERDRSETLKLIQRTGPRTWERATLVQMWNARGGALKVEASAFQDIAPIRNILSDHAVAANNATHGWRSIATTLKSLGKTERWAEAGNQMNFSDTDALWNLRVPLFVGKKTEDGNFEPIAFAKLGVPQALDVFERNPEIRARVQSKSAALKTQGKKEWADKLCEKVFGINPADIGPNYRLYIPQIPDTFDEKQILEMEFKDIANPRDASQNVLFHSNLTIDPRTNEIIPDDTFYPFMRPVLKTDRYNNVVTQREPDSGVLHVEYDQPKPQVVNSVDSMRNALQGFLDIALDIEVGTGRIVGVHDRAFLGNPPYDTRRAFSGPQFGAVYETTPVNQIYYAEGGQKDVISSEAKKIIPEISFLENALKPNTPERQVFYEGLENASEKKLMKLMGYSKYEKKLLRIEHNQKGTDLREYLLGQVIDLRVNLIKSIYQTSSLEPALAPYMSAIATKEKVVIPTQIRLRGFEGRYHTKEVTIPNFGKVKSEVPYLSKKASTVDFASYLQSVRFMIANGTTVTTIRSADQMTGIADGIVERREGRDLYEGMNFFPIIARLTTKDTAHFIRGNLGSLSKRAKKEVALAAALPPDQKQAFLEGQSISEASKSSIRDGLRRLRRPEAIHTLVRSYDTENWDMDPVQDDIMPKLLNYSSSAAAAAASRLFVLSRVTNIQGPFQASKTRVNASQAEKEIDEIKEQFTNDVTLSAYSGTKEQGERAKQLVDNLFLNTRYHKKGDKIRLLKTKGDGFEREAIPLDPRNDRPELGITRQTISISSRDDHEKSETVLLGPGLNVIYEAEDRDQVCPTTESYQGRALGAVQIYNIIHTMTDKGAVYYGPIFEHLFYHLATSVENGTYKYDMQMSPDERYEQERDPAFIRQ